MTCPRCDGIDPVLACTCDEQFSKHYTYRNVDKPPEERRMKTEEQVREALSLNTASLEMMRSHGMEADVPVVAAAMVAGAVLQWVAGLPDGGVFQELINDLRRAQELGSHDELD